MVDSLRQSYLADIRLLIAEDNLYSMKMILNVLRAFGFRDIFEANNGADALELFWCKQIDLIITDHFMPLYTGADLTRHIRWTEDSPNPYVPIIAVTPGTTRMVVEQLRDAGVNEIVAKPFTPKDLLAKITATIQRPREFVKCENYIGPDRRRHDASSYNGPERRNGMDRRNNREQYNGEDRRGARPNGIERRNRTPSSAQPPPAKSPAEQRTEPTIKPSTQSQPD